MAKNNTALKVETMSFAGEVPWDGVGREINPEQSPKQILKAAGLDWTVEKIPAFVDIGGEQVQIDRSALVRSSDSHILSVVTNEWNPLQNLEAFEFFSEFAKAGKLQMHSAGSLKQGELVWALAKLPESSFTLFEEDTVESYLLFTNPHRFGKSIDIRFVPMRLMCWNSLPMALTNAQISQARVSHRVKFDPVAVKDTLDVALMKMDQYKAAAERLAAKRVTEDDVIVYFNELFPLLSKKEDPRETMSRKARMAFEVLHTQPGAEYGRGTMWQAFNAVLYTIDHLAGRSIDNRLESAWFGHGKDYKSRAIDLALEMTD